MWNCGSCNGKTGQPILVPYITLRTGERRLQPWCSWCDSIDRWPVYTRTHPKV